MEKSSNLVRENHLEESRPDAERIRSYLKVEQKKLAIEFQEKQKDIPVDEQITISSDFHIIPPVKTYQEGHRRITEQYLRRHRDFSSPAEIMKDENERAGFVFEMLKTSIMHKKIGERFIVVRSSHYDDNINKVDNVLVDRKTGHTICALDEVSPKSMQDGESLKKQREIRMRNFGFVEKSEGFKAPRQIRIEQGVTLQYGIELVDGKIFCKEFHHLPIFLLNLDHEHLNQGLRHFLNDQTSSEYEDKLFKYFLSSFSLQIQGFKLNTEEYAQLPNDMRERIESLEAFLKEQGIR